MRQFKDRAVRQSFTASGTARVHPTILLLSCIAGIVLFAGLLIAQAELYTSLALGVLLAVLAYFPIVTFKNEGRQIFHPLILVSLYFFVYFELRAIYLLTYPKAFHLGRFYYDDYLPAAIWCAIAAYVAALWGFHTQLPAKILKRWPVKERTWPRTLPLLQIMILLAIGGASCIYLIQKGLVVGNLQALGAATHADPVSGIPVLLSVLLNIGALAVCASLIEKPPRIEAMIAWALLLVCILLICLRVVYSGSKQVLLEPMIEFAILYNYRVKRLNFRKLLLFGMPTLMLSFGALNIYRFVIVGEAGGAPTSLSEVGDRLSYAVDYFSSGRNEDLGGETFERLMERQFGVDALAITMRYTPELRPYGLGIDFLDIPAQALIPRQLWSDKRIRNISDDFEADYLGVPTGGLTSMHVIADLYQNLHMFGVVAGFFIIGTLFRYLYLATDPEGSAVGSLVYAVMAPALIHGFEWDVDQFVIFAIRLALLMTLSRWLLTSAQRARRQAVIVAVAAKGAI